MNILLTRVREQSLSGKIAALIHSPSNEFINAYCLTDDWDINNLSTYPIDLGTYDAVINTTGVTLTQSVLEHNPEEALNIFQTNIIGAMNLTTEYAKAREKNGIIIHVGSVGSRKVFTNCSAYCASKAALAHYIQCAGYELKSKEIYVVGVHPGNMKDTKMTRNVTKDLMEQRHMSIEQIAEIYKDAHETENVAMFIINLLSMPFADITGENFYLGRGWKG
jgi:NAD(P)-dependent dehydrogenase (short-subunit alcohol dehydrogenase family)